MRQYFEVSMRHAYPRALDWMGGFIDSAVGRERKYAVYFIREPPPSLKADLGYPIMRELRGKKTDVSEIVSEMNEDPDKPAYVEKILFEKGYLNLYFDRERFAEAFFEEMLRENEDYPFQLLGKKYKVVVEHTSANPVHPMHIGHGRNTVLGDTIARLLRKGGASVETRFYIDDVGRQTAILAYGLSRLGKNENEWKKLMGNTKPDHWIGLVYAISHTLVELWKTKNLIKSKKGEIDPLLIEKQDELVADCARLREKDPILFDILSEKILGEDDPEREIARLSFSYERGDPETVSFVRKAVNLSLEGFRQTLERMNVYFDKWDWESEVVWKGLVRTVIERAKSMGVITEYKGAQAIDLEEVNQNIELKKTLRIPERLELPPLILLRSDGTTLYTLRDVAYSLQKFSESGADYVINVVGKEQTLPQAQVRAALYVLGYREYAKRLLHYSYEMVMIPGRRMSGRKGEYISLDDVMDALIERAKYEVEKRGVVDKKMLDDTAKAVGVGALRYSLVSVSAEKTLTISFDDIVDFEKNTAPYIQYTHARASSILLKAGSIEKRTPETRWVRESEINYLLLRELSKYPYILGKSIAFLEPEHIVSYLWSLAQMFNKWYQIQPVLNDTNPSRRNFKLLLVYATKFILSSALNVLGVEAPERM